MFRNQRISKRTHSVWHAMEESKNETEFKINLKKLTARKLKLIEYYSRGQASNYLWFHYRKHTIGGTVVKQVLNGIKANKCSNSIHNAISKTKKSNLQHIPAIKFGIDNEPIARKALLKHYRKMHPRAICLERGVQFNNALLGASLDGILSCECHGQLPIEIKCCYSLGQSTFAEKGHMLSYLNEDLTLVRTHVYWYQVQYYMKICNFDKILFYCWALNDQHSQIVHYDREFDVEYEKLESFYFTHYLPNLLH